MSFDRDEQLHDPNRYVALAVDRARSRGKEETASFTPAVDERWQMLK